MKPVLKARPQDTAVNAGRVLGQKQQSQQRLAPVTTQVTETVRVSPTTTRSRTDLMSPPEAWGPGELRDYVVSQIEEFHGAFPREARKEHSIFTRFHKEFGADAARIALYVFETCDGIWRSAPVSITRFCRGSDDYFARPILERLSQD